MAASGVSTVGPPTQLYAPKGIVGLLTVRDGAGGPGQQVETIITDNIGGQTANFYGKGVNFQAFIIPFWASNIDYSLHYDELVQYGTSTAPAGSYPDNIYYASGVGVPVVGVPPLVLGSVSTGWARASTSTLPQPTPSSNGYVYTMATDVIAGSPAFTNFFGGGRPSVNNDAPLGVTIQQADTVTAGGNNGAQLVCSGRVFADGFTYLPTNQALGPASSSPEADGTYIALTSDSAPFSLGKNYTWALNPTPGANGTYWWSVTTGTGGTSVVTCPACSVGAMIFVQRELDVGPAAGALTVSLKTATSFTLTSQSATNTLVTTDSAFYNFQIMNPDWSS